METTSVEWLSGSVVQRKFKPQEVLHSIWSIRAVFSIISCEIIVFFDGIYTTYTPDKENVVTESLLFQSQHHYLYNKGNFKALIFVGKRTPFGYMSTYTNIKRSLKKPCKCKHYIMLY